MVRFVFVCGEAESRGAEEAEARAEQKETEET